MSAIEFSVSRPPPVPALFISAPASNQGKTTVTAALARFHSDRGRVVRVFKTGPDFLDPMILERASGQPVYQLDLWMGGEAHCRRLLRQGAARADLILIEGVMGLFDGTPSSADLAQCFGVPVLAVIDAEAMAQTFGAVAYGLAHYRPGLSFFGALGNRVAGAGHEALLKESVPPSLRYLGSLPRAPAIELPGRHLGLVQAGELVDLEQRLAAAAATLKGTELESLPAAVDLAATDPAPSAPERVLAGVRIGIARDRAFSFVYPANLDLLRELGAELVFFSPLSDATLRSVDAVYLPGGYPELHLTELSANRALAADLRRHVQSGKPAYAECGGLLYLLDSLTDIDGHRAPMAGVLPGEGLMHAGLQGFGYQSASFPGGTLRGHAFHHSTVSTSLTPIARGQSPYKGASAGEAVYAHERLIASYFHGYFPSNPAAAARLFLPD